MTGGARSDQPLSVRISAAMYRGLMLVLPRSFRARFGPDMVDTFVDICLDAHDRRGVWGLTGVWLRALPQLLQAALGERKEAAAASSLGLARESATDGDGPNGIGVPGANVIDVAWQDLRFALRALIRRPGFAATTVTILALGVGSATAIFSVVDGLVLKDLAVPEPERLVFFEQGQHTVPEFRSWQDNVRAIAPLVAIAPRAADLTGTGPPERVALAAVTPGYFELLGARAFRGRLLEHSDVSAARVVVLSHRVWTSLFGGSDAVIGRTLRLDGEAHEIVGVTGPDFRPPMRLNAGPIDLWRPLDVGLPAYQESQSTYLRVFGRLAPDASIEVAQQQVDAGVEQVVARFPDAYAVYEPRGRFVPVSPLHAAEVVDLEAPLFTLFGAVGLMLVVACATVASLVSARLRDRSPEIRIRVALGSSRRRIVSQLLAESLLLSAVGGVVGLGLSATGIGALRGVLPLEMPGITAPTIDARVFAFMVSVSVAVAVLFGLAPALLSSGRGLSAAARQGRETSSVTIRRFGRGLVTTELALCFVLLTGATLLGSSFRGLLNVDPGFEPEGAIAFQVRLSNAYGQPQERDRFRQEVIRRLNALGEVESAAMGLVAPFSQFGSCCRFAGVTRADGSDSVRVTLHPVSSGFFTTLGARLIEGVDIPDVAGPGAMPVVLTRTTADRLFPEGDAIGRVLALRVDGGFEGRVTGVVEDIPFYSLDRTSPTAFVPFHPTGSVNRVQTFVVRLRGGATGQGDALRRAVWSVDPGLPVPTMMSLSDRVDLSLLESKVMTVAFVGFAAFALVLALAATYGTVAYVVSRRRRELGIRLALGADPGRLVRFVIAAEARAAAVGLLFGLIAARLLSGVLAAEVFGITPNDPVVFGTVTLGLGFAVLLATYIPTRAVTRTALLRDALDASGRL